MCDRMNAMACSMHRKQQRRPAVTANKKRNKSPGEVAARPTKSRGGKRVARTTQSSDRSQRKSAYLSSPARKSRRVSVQECVAAEATPSPPRGGFTAGWLRIRPCRPGGTPSCDRRAQSPDTTPFSKPPLRPQLHCPATPASVPSARRRRGIPRCRPAADARRR